MRHSTKGLDVTSVAPVISGHHLHQAGDIVLKPRFYSAGEIFGFESERDRSFFELRLKKHGRTKYATLRAFQQGAEHLFAKQGVQVLRWERV